MKSGIHILILATLSCFASKILAQPQMPVPFKFEYLDVNDGLSHGQVNCILKDSRGYVWIGTDAGLNLFNGYTVQNFTYDPRDSSSINSTQITDLFEGPEGNIWVNTPAGLNVYNPVLEIFDHNLGKYARQYQLPNTQVVDILHAKNGLFWFINANQGITRYDKEGGSTIHFGANAKRFKIQSNSVSCIKENSAGDLWLVHTNGFLEKIDAERLEVTERYTYLKDHLADGQTYDMTVDSDDDLWIYMPFATRGVFFFKADSGKMVNYNKDSESIQLNADLVKGVVEESKGKIWIGTDHGGINVIDKKSRTISYLLHHPEIENSLSHNSVYCLYKDDNDIIWVGTYKKGVNYYHKKIKRFDHYKHWLSVPGSLPFDDVNRFVEDKKGNIWIGTNGGGLLYFDRSDNTFTQYKYNANDPESLSSDVIVSMLIDETNTLWVGTYFGGLNRFDGKHFKKYQVDANQPKGITGNNIWELYEDSKGNLWIGTLSNGLNRYIRDKDQFAHYPLNTISSDTTLHINYILAIEEDKNGNIWLGGGGGIDIINGDTGKVRFNRSAPASPILLATHTITSLHKDHLGRMWIGTQEGLYVYADGGDMLKLFTTKEGLPHNSILTILEDNSHNLWFSTPNGISNLVLSDQSDFSNARFINYDESDGLQAKVFNENAALKTSKGELIFGGANGFNIFNPEDLKINDEVPKIVFTDFQLFNKSLEVKEQHEGRAILSKALSYTHKITLKHDENVFSIEFAALSFLHPGKNKYKYMLEGFDNQWREADDTRKATYTNLDAGHYTFKVIASNNDGVWSDQQGAGIDIVVLPPFWKTNWAYASYIILIVTVLYVVRRIMLQRERVKFRIEQERREAHQMHELDLLKIRFFTNLSHEFRTPLSLILAPLDKLMASAQSQYHKLQYQMINRNARRLLNLLNQLLDFRKLEVDTIGLNTSEGNIIKFIEESVYSFSDLSENKNVKLHFNTNVDELYASFDMDKLEKILFNLLSNAFKFTPESGRIDVAVDCHNHLKAGFKEVQIKIKDTGIGIPQEQQKRIFERFFRNDVPGSVINQGSGIGLAITQEFVKIHGGTISVESEPQQGTCFTVTLPVEEVGKENAPRQAIEEPNYISEDLQHYTQQHIHDENTPLILLVEDSEDFRFYLKDNLGVHFKVIDAPNGKVGWQKALSLLPDLIVSDLMMPELNGMELCKKVKEDTRTSHIPFVLLTADATEDKQLKSLNIGADDYVTKPFNFEILMSRIKNLILQRQALQKVYQKRITVETSEIEIVSLDDKLIQNAVKVVEQYIADPEFTVEMFSKELGLSRVHLYKKLVSLTGTTPVEFIRKIRLQRAAQFLKESQLTVAEVAYKVGFNNRKYFTKHFKMTYNMPPSAYASQKN